MINNRSWAEINLAALERNLRLIRDSLPQNVHYISVVKADAYGHGIHPTAARLMRSGVDVFAVANVQEASEIREMGSGWPILILGPLLEEEDEALFDFDLIPTLSSEEELHRFKELSQKHQKQNKRSFADKTCWPASPSLNARLLVSLFLIICWCFDLPFILSIIKYHILL